MKKILSVILSVVILFSFVSVAFATDCSASLPNIYGDGMLFKQNSTAVFNGNAKSGAVITAELVKNGVVTARGTGYTSEDGSFSVSFPTPAGSYENYTVRLYENGTLFTELEDITFGEIWLASGQSNMSYPLSQAMGGNEMFNNKTKLSEWIRVLMIDAITPYEGSADKIPVDPQNDIEGAYWTKADNLAVYDMSAVGYYFAAELMEYIDMPVGIINASLGGSSIVSWLSREAIDSDAAVKKDFVDGDIYIEYSDWNESEQSMYSDMTSNFNLKIAPLKAFDISGMIWYQGETEAMYNWEQGRYSRAFDLLQRSYTEYFGYSDGMLPIVFTSLVSCQYTEKLSMLDKNIEFTYMQQYAPQSRALISIYDIPLDYYENLGAIHPSQKQPVGERMAYAAYGLVYSDSDTYTTATVKSVEIKDGSIYVSFRNTGNGLVCNGDKLFGFSLCSENGIYAQAEAEIVGSDTVRIYSENVTAPVSAAYAYKISNINSNLYATDENGVCMPVACFITDSSVGTHYEKSTLWTDCEIEKEWRAIVPYDKTAIYDTWTADGADIEFTASSAYSGSTGLHITTDKLINTSFSVSPVTTYTKNLLNYHFSDSESDYGDYSKITFRIRNNGDSDIQLKSLRFYKNSAIWYTPANCDSGNVSFNLPADGEWYTLSYDLNTLYFEGNEGGASYSNEKLHDIKYIKLVFGYNGINNADISIDEFRFTPEGEQGSTEFNNNIKHADNIFEYVSALITIYIAKIKDVFVKIFG